jgi:hypothetical protein
LRPFFSVGALVFLGFLVRDSFVGYAAAVAAAADAPPLLLPWLFLFCVCVENSERRKIRGNSNWSHDISVLRPLLARRQHRVP